MSRDVRIINLDDPAQKMAAVNEIMSATGLHEFTLHKRRRGRSLSANSYLWGIVYPAVARGMAECWGESVDGEQVHEFCKGRFLSHAVIDRSTGEIMGHVAGSTAVLDTSEFAEYIENIVKFAGEFLSVEVPAPDRCHVQTVDRHGCQQA